MVVIEVWVELMTRYAKLSGQQPVSELRTRGVEIVYLAVENTWLLPEMGLTDT